MRIYHSIEYTIPAPFYGAGTREQCHEGIIRNRRLTDTGCERIIRRDMHPEAIVVRVERMTYAQR